MAQDIGNLVVKVAMDNSNFQQGVQNLNRSMRKVQSEFKVATAGSKEYGTGLEGLKAKSTMLSKTVDLQSQKVKMNRDKFEESKKTLDDNVKKQTELKTKVEAAKTAYEKSKKTLGENAEETKKLKAEYEELSQEYKDNEEKIRNNVKSMEYWETQANNSEAELKNLQSELDATNKEIEKQSSGWYKLSEKMEPIGKKMQSIGSAMTDIGKSMTTKLTLPIIGVGAAATKLGMEFEASMSGVQATTQASSSEMQQLEKKARDLGASTSKSAKDAADGMRYLGLAGWDTNQILKGTEPVLRLAEAGQMDLAQAADLTTNSMSALGLEVEDLPHYLDLVAQAARSSNTDIDEMMQAYIAVGGTLRNLNVPMEESAVILGVMANKGIKGAESGNALNAVVTNLTAPAGRAKKALDELNLSAFDGNGEFKGLTNVLMEVKEKTKGMTEEQRNAILAGIAGKEHTKTLNALLNGLDDDLVTLTGDIEGADGALLDMAKTMQDNNKGSLTELKSAIEELGLKIYDVLRPGIAKVIDLLKKWTDKLNNLTPAQQETIVKIAGMIAAIGPLLLAGGKLIGGIGTMLVKFSILSGAIASAGGVAAAFGTVMGVITGPIGLTVGAIAALGIGAVKLSKHFKQASIESDVFGDEVSAGTQKAVGSFLELDEQASVALKQLSWSGQELSKDTDEMARQITDSVDQMKTQVVGKLEEQKKEGMNQLQSLFKESKTMSEEEKNQTLAIAEKRYDEQIQKTEEGNARIAEILNAAKEGNRAITQEEADEINQIKNDMVNTGIEVLSEGEAEQMAIMSRLKQQSGIISAEQAAEVVQNSLKQKDETIAAADQERNERFKLAAQLRAEGGAENEALADKVEAEAQRQYEESTEKARAMHRDVIAEAKAQAGEHANEVNWETGQVKTKFESMRDSASGTMKDLGKKIKDKWQEIRTDTGEKVETMKAKVAQKHENMKVDIGSKMQKIKADTASKWESIRANTGSKVESIRANTSSKWQTLKTNTSTKWGEIKDAMVNPVVKAKEKIKAAVDKIEGFFNKLKLEIPPIKLPKLPSPKVTGKFSLTPPRAPKISWNAEGGIFRKPTIFATPNAGLQGFGEAGAEAIIPLKKLNGIVEDSVKKVMSTQNTGAPVIIEVPVVLEGREIARVTTPYISTNLAMKTKGRR